MTDARLHPRYEIRVGAEVTPQVGHPFTATTRDLSEGGIGLECDRPLEEGTAITLCLFVVVDDIEDEATAPLELLGKIVWCRVKADAAYLAGVEFFDLEPAVAQKVHTLIAATAAAG